MQTHIPKSTRRSRIGMHYYADPDHYRAQDLQLWLPKLQALGAGWLTVQALPERAIPEDFLRGLIDGGIEPVLQFDLPPETAPTADEMAGMLQAYANWGVEYISLFERPNSKDKWSSSMWTQPDLVKRFMATYMPLATLVQQAGMTNVFPPLDPGGDYWDTAFLRTALQEIEQQASGKFLDRFILGLHAWAGDASLNWGAGGPERWAGAKPYETPEGEQDQLGFRIFDWYAAISEAVFGQPLPMLITAGGSAAGKGKFSLAEGEADVDHAARNLAIAKMLTAETDQIDEINQLEPVSEEVLACNFWLLAGQDDSPEADAAWYMADGEVKVGTQPFLDWQRDIKQNDEDANVTKTVEIPAEPSEPTEPTELAEPAEAIEPVEVANPVKVVEVNNFSEHSEAIVPIESHTTPLPTEVGEHSIQHYLLLPTYEWGVADWHLEVIRPFVKKYHPTVGYSLEEAARAERVTILGGAKVFPIESIEELKAGGSEVEQIDGDGTVIATLFKNL